LSSHGGRDRRPAPRHRGVAGRALVLLALVAGLFAAAAAPVAAAALPAHAATAAVKPTPVPPAGVAVGTVNVAKPHGVKHSVARPMTAWSVSLTASSYALWPTQYTTLTATANGDVGPTIYYIDILDQYTGTVVCHMGTGTVCSVAVTSAKPGLGAYVAYISDATDVGGDHEVAISSSITIDWFGVDISLAASLNTLPVGNTSTLTETSSSNIGPTPFYVQIWDTTTGTLLVQCGSGTTCSVNVSQSVATTHTYIATFAGFTSSAAAYPPPTPQSTSATSYVTWTGSGLLVSLTAPAITVNGPETVTATASINVGPTPYYIEIFDENGTLLHSCGSGTTCSFSYTPARQPGSNLVAFISSSSATLPPANIQASSNTVTTMYEFIG
jgi:hypothetical protein